MIDRGEIRDGKTLVAIMRWWKMHRAQNSEAK